MAKRQIINTPIPSIDTAWDNGTEAYSGEAVENFIKAQFKSKVGALFLTIARMLFNCIYVQERGRQDHLAFRQKR